MCLMDTRHDFKGLTDFVEIFRAGQQTDSKGRTHNFTTGDLDSIIANHDPAHPAPHVITHNSMYSPFRYGEAVELKREGDVLFARSENIEPQFAALVKNRNLPDRSVRIKPIDGGLKLDHIAWLGAEPPAVEGMAPVEFSAPTDDGFDFMSIESAEDSYTPSVLGRMMRRIRDVWIDKFSLEEADKLLPEYEIDSINDHAKQLRTDSEFSSPDSRHNSGTLTPASASNTGDGGQNGDPSASIEDEGREDFSTNNNNNSHGDVTMSQLTHTQEQVDAKVKEAVDAANEKSASDFAAKQDESNAALDAERNLRLSADFQKQADDLLDQGRLTPAQAEGMSDFMLQLASGEDAQFEFSTGEGEKAETVKKSPLDWFREFTASLGKQIDMGETNADEADASSADQSFNAPIGAHVDADKLALHNKALQYQAQHEGVDYITAVQAVEQ